MAKGTPGMSGADLANLVNEAALFAVRRAPRRSSASTSSPPATGSCIGRPAQSLILTAEEKRATAYHEGGHAMLATVLQHGDPVHKVTILPTGMALGVTQTMPRGAPRLLQRVHRATASAWPWAAASPRSSCSASAPPAPPTTSSERHRHGHAAWCGSGA